MRCSYLLLIIALITSLIGASVLAERATASLVAADDASDSTYDDGWDNSDNGGFGFGNWVLSGSNNAGLFIGNSTGNGDGDGNSDGDINTSDEAFGSFADFSQISSAVRPFTGDLLIGQTFSVDIDDGSTAVGGSGSVGFGLQNGAGQSLVELFYAGGANTTYSVNAVSLSGTLPAPTDEGLRVAVTLTDADSFSMTIDELANGAGVDHTVTGDLLTPVGGQGIAEFRFFNFNAGGGSANDAYFNSLSISAVPEVSAAIAIPFALVMTGFGTMISRRRRRVDPES